MPKRHIHEVHKKQYALPNKQSALPLNTAQPCTIGHQMVFGLCSILEGKKEARARLRRHPLIDRFSLVTQVSALPAERNLHLVISHCEIQPLVLHPIFNFPSLTVG
jgi:hypothetical protein